MVSPFLFLLANESAQGLDIPDIEIIVQYGISRDVPTTLQRGGRSGRGSKDALFLIMYESWVDEIDLSEILFNHDLDPDHPNVKELSQHSNKRARLGLAMIKIIQLDETCLRLLFAVYLSDQSLQGLPFHFLVRYHSHKISIARHFTARWCCSRHDNTDFHIKHFFKGRLLYGENGRLYYGDINETDRIEILLERKKRKAGIPVRKTAFRPTLVSRITVWRFETHSRDKLCSVRPPSFIIDDKSIKKLARLHPSNITLPAHVTAALNETPEWESEWSTPIFNIIQSYDQELDTLRKETMAKKKVQKKRARVEQDRAMFEATSMDAETSRESHPKSVSERRAECDSQGAQH